MPSSCARWLSPMGSQELGIASKPCSSPLSLQRHRGGSAAVAASSGSVVAWPAAATAIAKPWPRHRASGRSCVSYGTILRGPRPSIFGRPPSSGGSPLPTLLVRLSRPSRDACVASQHAPSMYKRSTERFHACPQQAWRCQAALAGARLRKATGFSQAQCKRTQAEHPLFPRRAAPPQTCSARRSSSPTHSSWPSPPPASSGRASPPRSRR